MTHRKLTQIVSHVAALTLLAICASGTTAPKLAPGGTPEGAAGKQALSCVTLESSVLPVESKYLRSCLDMDVNRDGAQEVVLFTWEGVPALYSSAADGTWKLLTYYGWNASTVYHFDTPQDGPICGPMVGVKDRTEISPEKDVSTTYTLVDLTDRVDAFMYRHYTFDGTDSEVPARVLGRWDGVLAGRTGSMVLVDGTFVPHTAPDTGITRAPSLFWVMDCGGVSGIYGLTDDNHTITANSSMRQDGSFAFRSTDGVEIRYDGKGNLTVDGN